METSFIDLGTCALAVKKHFPSLTPRQQRDILWCGTSFPAGCGEQVDKQLAELERRSNGNYEDAIRIAHEESDETWERYRPLREEWHRVNREQAELREKEKLCADCGRKI